MYLLLPRMPGMGLGAQWVYSTCQLTYTELIRSPHLPPLIVLWLSMPLCVSTLAMPALPLGVGEDQVRRM